MIRRILSGALALVACVALPAAALAQSAIAGVVRDSSGGVLPGVTVEASSPALIEKVKTTTTNESGQYRVVDLRPGVYTVTFQLTGFNTVVREDVALEADFTAPINIEMRVGALEESITVTGESPVVDVQTSSRREVVSQQLIESLPTGRNFQLMAGTVPAVTTGVFDVGGSSTMWTGGSLLVHGSLTVDSRTMIDGMVVDAMFGGGQCSCTYDNEGQTQEIAVQVSGGAAENQLSGVLVNRIPRTGGNRFSGDTVLLFANDGLQGQNLDDDLRRRGLTTPSRLDRNYDVNFSVGGPIIKDRLWFFVSGRHFAYNNFVANAFYADGSQAVDDNDVKAYPARLTAQLTRRDRVTTLFDWASKNRGHRGLSATVAPEASFTQKSPAQHIAQAKWTSTPGNRLLLEAGYTQSYNAQKYGYQPEVARATCFTAFFACAPGTGYGDIPHLDTLLGNRTWRAAASGPGVTAPSFTPSISHVVVGSVSYVTGAHNFKVGFQHRSGWEKDQRFNVNGDLRQEYRNGVPFRVVIFNTPINRRTDVNADFGAYVQDTWTFSRLTLSPGVRFDYFNSEVPEQVAPAGRFVPERRFARVADVPNWKDVSPRFGASYDLFGTGKTAIKGTIGKYVQSQGPGFASTYNPVSFFTDNRTWDDLNGDDIAQENEIGPTSNASFGVRRNRNPDPDITRPYQVVSDIGIQHELLPGFAVSVSYNQRDFRNIIATDNLATTHSDYTLLTVADPRANGQTLPVYNLSTAKRDAVDELDTNSPHTRGYKGVDVSFNLRLRGATFYGGTSTGRLLEQQCQPDDPNGLRFCDEADYDVPFRTGFKLAGSYALPYDIRLSANLQSILGSERAITYQVTRSLVPTLTQTSVNVRLNEPGSLYNDRVNQVDLSLTKSFRRNGIEVRPELSLFNLLNANPVTNITNTFGPTLDRVNAILEPRLVRLGLYVKF